MGGPESFDVTTAALFYGLSFVIQESTSTGLQDGCNTTCVESTFSIELLRGATSLGSFTVEPVNDALTFVGLTDAGGFDAVRVRETVGTDDNEIFGEFQFAAAAPVPLPAGLPLFLACGAALVLLGRRRS